MTDQIVRTISQKVEWMRLANLQYSSKLTCALLARFGSEPNAIFCATPSELAQVSGFLPRHLSRLEDTALQITDRQIKYMEQYDVQLLVLGDNNYPSNLRDIPDPPAMLFVRGQMLDTDRFGVGMVGSRHATPYGKSIAEKLARELSQRGLTIISGGAIGIDAASHRGAVDAGGRTIAFLGCGLDVDYPKENRALFDKILENGALVSEYPLGAQPESWRFPLRNRLISGLSMGVMVVEAPWQSGALITSRFALEQGRPVMTVPGNIDRPSSAGSNELLKDGAIPITECEDVLRALNIIAMPAKREHQGSLDLPWEPTQLKNEDMESAPRTAAKITAKPNVSSQLSQQVLNGLNSNQKKLLESLSLTPQHIDLLASESGLPSSTAGVEMTMLELTGLVKRLPGNLYIRIL